MIVNEIDVLSGNWFLLFNNFKTLSFFPESPYKCYHWSEKDLEKNHNGGWSIEKEKRTCEGYENFIFTLGDDSKAPGCGGCWCCQPKNKGKTACMNRS